jgi:hypothetical protein
MMIREHIKKLVEWWKLQQAEHDRDMEDWKESDPEAYNNFMVEQWQMK